MESISERKNLKRKAEEFGNDLEAETQEEETETSTAAEDDILDLCDDILLGEVITQVPWHNRPIIMAFSRAWADTMIHSFPYYARLQQPHILSNCLVLFHDPLDSGQNNQSLWVYCDKEGSLVINVPVPISIPEESSSVVKFLRDSNDERLYCFTPLEEYGHKMYNVSVYDLRAGNIQWKKLPPLPSLEDHSLLSCCSFDNGGCCTTYYTVCVPSVINQPTEDFAIWSLTGRNDGTEWQSQWQRELNASPEQINKVIGFDLKEEPPIYLEFTLPSDSANPLKSCLYEMCQHGQYSTDYNHILETPDHLLMQFQDDGSHSPRITNCTLYYIRVFEQDSEISLYKFQLGEENSTWVDSFDEFWQPWVPFLDPLIESTARKVSSTKFSQWKEESFTFSMSVDVNAIHLVPKATLYVFRRVAVLLQ